MRSRQSRVISPRIRSRSFSHLVIVSGTSWIPRTFLSRENRPRQISRRICGRRNTRWLRDTARLRAVLYLLRMYFGCRLWERTRAPMATFARRVRECIRNCMVKLMRAFHALIIASVRCASPRVDPRLASCLEIRTVPLGRRPSRARSRDKRISVFGNSLPALPPVPLASSEHRCRALWRLPDGFRRLAGKKMKVHSRESQPRYYSSVIC